MAEQPSERERFEAWALERHEQLPIWTGVRYRSDVWEDLWICWQARAALSQPSTAWTHEINQELERQYLKGFQAGKAFAVSEQGWRTIESAPRDGTEILVSGNNYGEQDEGRHQTISAWKNGCWVEISQWNEESKLTYLTHWMPLPPPPPIEPREEKL